MSEEGGFGTCGLPQCKVATNGKCVDGLDLSVCKNYRLPDLSMPPLTEVVPTATPDKPPRTISVAPATGLPRQQAELTLKSCPSRVIAILGPNDAGKTSLLSTLYDLFQLGPVDGYIFKGSRTLHALEAACHHARTASERGEAYTGRTELGSGLQFYQLDLMRRPDRSRINLLLADRSGEFYRDIPNEPQIAAGFEELKRANTLTVLVDGARLADPQKRHAVRSDVLMLVQGICDAQALGRVRRLALVLTKVDKVNSSPKAAALKQGFADICAHIRQHHAGSFESIEAFEVAARPTTVGYVNGQGVQELFAYWLQTSPTPIESESEVGFDRYFQSFRPIPVPP